MRPPLSGLLAVLGALTVVPLAGAHVSVHPNALPAGAFTTIVIRVPSEEPKASATGVDVKFPHGFVSVFHVQLPGWTTKIIYRKLAKPVTTEEGEIVDQEVDQVVWRGGEIAPGQYLDFPLLVRIPADATGKVTFKVLQRYGGDVVRWIGAPGTREPAPQVLVTAKDAQVADYAETPPEGAGTSTKTSVQVGPTVKDDHTRANVALVLGAAGLAAGLLALGLTLARRGAAGKAAPR